MVLAVVVPVVVVMAAESESETAEYLEREREREKERAASDFKLHWLPGYRSFNRLLAHYRLTASIQSRQRTG